MTKNRHESLNPEQTHQLGDAECTLAHVHQYGHIVYPAQGVLSIITEAGSWLAPPNRAAWVPAGIVHQHRAYGKTDMRIVFMANDAATQLPNDPTVFAVTPLAREAILALGGGRKRTGDSLDRLRQVMIEDFGSVAEQPLHLPEPNDDRLLTLTRIVENDMTSPATLADLGRQVGASERTLSRLFQSQTGMSFRQWRTQLRVHKALLLLAEGNSVVDVAAACGWASPSTFIDAFISLVGQTPGSYQRSLIATRA